MANISSICVYCGSRRGAQPSYSNTAQRLGQEIAKRGMRLVYGGGQVGLMGVVADAALAAGGEVVGVIPKHLENWEVGHHGLSELHVVGSMHERKQMMFELSDGFIALPGGIGTLDETFEILTWRQLRVHDKPLVILDDHGFWRPLQGMLDAIIQGGFADQGISDYFSFVSNIDGGFDALSAAPGPRLALKPLRPFDLPAKAGYVPPE